MIWLLTSPKSLGNYSIHCQAIKYNTLICGFSFLSRDFWLFKSTIIHEQSMFYRLSYHKERVSTGMIVRNWSSLIKSANIWTGQSERVLITKYGQRLETSPSRLCSISNMAASWTSIDQSQKDCISFHAWKWMIIGWKLISRKLERNVEDIALKVLMNFRLFYRFLEVREKFQRIDLIHVLIINIFYVTKF